MNSLRAYNKKNSISVCKNIEVRFSEFDSIGILWHGHYVQFCEDGREYFGNQFGISYLDIREHGYIAPLTKINLEFKNYVTYGTLLEIKTTFHYMKTAKIVFTYEISKKKSNKIVCIGESEQVFLNAQTFRLEFSKPQFFINWEKNHFFKVRQ